MGNTIIHMGRTYRFRSKTIDMFLIPYGFPRAGVVSYIPTEVIRDDGFLFRKEKGVYVFSINSEMCKRLELIGGNFI